MLAQLPGIFLILQAESEREAKNGAAQKCGAAALFWGLFVQIGFYQYLQQFIAVNPADKAA